MRLNLLARKRAAVIGGTTAVIVLGFLGTAWANPFGWWAAQSHPFALFLANDSDFGMDHLLGQNEAACEASGLSDTTACAPVKSTTTGRYLVHQKTLDAAGVVDDGEVLQVDVSKLPLVLGTTTVTVTY